MLATDLMLSILYILLPTSTVLLDYTVVFAVMSVGNVVILLSFVNQSSVTHSKHNRHEKQMYIMTIKLSYTEQN